MWTVECVAMYQYLQILLYKFYKLVYHKLLNFFFKKIVVVLAFFLTVSNMIVRHGNDETFNELNK